MKVEIQYTKALRLSEIHPRDAGIIACMQIHKYDTPHQQNKVQNHPIQSSQLWQKRQNLIACNILIYNQTRNKNNKPISRKAASSILSST